jgi:PadR family transcriptional regulator, regulatory protein PadR
MKTFPRISGIETQILELLAEHSELYGLEMIEASGERLKRGTVYVTLDRMEDKGFVSSREVEGQGRGPSRRVYKLTGQGSRALAASQAAATAWAMEARAL